MASVLILISVLFVGAMPWAGQHALIVLPLVAVAWSALLVLEMRDARPAPIARRAVESRRDRARSQRVTTKAERIACT